METIPPLSYTVGRAVQVSNLSRSRLYEFMSSGELAYSLVNGRRIILDEDLRALILRRRVIVQAA